MRPARAPWARALREVASASVGVDGAGGPRRAARGGCGPCRAPRPPRPGATRWPLWSARAATRAMPAPSTSSGTPGSARIARAMRATAVNRPAPISMPAVAERISSSWWASSNTTTSCSGSTPRAGGEVGAVEVGVDDEHVDAGGRWPGPARRSTPRPSGSGRRRGTRRPPTDTAPHARGEGSKSRPARSPSADVGAPLDEAQHLGLDVVGRRGPRRRACPASAARTTSLARWQAQVVRAALQGGEGERLGEVRRRGTAGRGRPAGPGGSWWRWPRPSCWPARIAGTR